MLVLTRKSAETIRIGEDVVIKVIRTGKGTVKLGIEAPADVRVLRGELAGEETAAPAAPAKPVRNAAPSRPAVESESRRPAFTFELDAEDAALPLSVACGGYFPVPAAA